jgi:hypothetical protein
LRSLRVWCSLVVEIILVAASAQRAPWWRVCFHSAENDKQNRSLEHHSMSMIRSKNQLCTEFLEVITASPCRCNLGTWFCCSTKHRKEFSTTFPLVFTNKWFHSKAQTSTSSLSSLSFFLTDLSVDSVKSTGSVLSTMHSTLLGVSDDSVTASPPPTERYGRPGLVPSARHTSDSETVPTNLKLQVVTRTACQGRQ